MSCLQLRDEEVKGGDAVAGLLGKCLGSRLKGISYLHLLFPEHPLTLKVSGCGVLLSRDQVEDAKIRLRDRLKGAWRGKTLPDEFSEVRVNEVRVNRLF